VIGRRPRLWLRLSFPPRHDPLWVQQRPDGLLRLQADGVTFPALATSFGTFEDPLRWDEPLYRDPRRFMPLRDRHAIAEVSAAEVEVLVEAIEHLPQATLLAPPGVWWEGMSWTTTAPPDPNLQVARLSGLSRWATGWHWEPVRTLPRHAAEWFARSA